MFNPFSLEGKTILVTGASSGIGQSIAIESSKMGAKTIVVGRDKQRLQETFDKLEGEGHMSFSADLTDENDMAKLVDVIPVIHGFVNAAGVLKLIPFKTQNLKSLQEIMNINFFAPTILTKELLRRKKLLSGSSIVYISSISGNNCTFIGNTAYSSSKGAITAMSKNIALELAPRNIRVNAIHPGMVQTNMIKTTLTPDQIVTGAEEYPLKRFGQPEDVAYAAIYLLSEASSWITGTGLLLDGGYTIK